MALFIKGFTISEQFISVSTGDSLHLNHEPDLFGREDKEKDDFLDCDWSTFGDFDDIEKLFR